MIFFVRLSSSTTFSIWQPNNAQQTLGDKRVCILKLATLPLSLCTLFSTASLGTLRDAPGYEDQPSDLPVRVHTPSAPGAAFRFKA
jgi:hypothetical protein